MTAPSYMAWIYHNVVHSSDQVSEEVPCELPSCELPPIATGHRTLPVEFSVYDAKDVRNWQSSSRPPIPATPVLPL